MMMMIVPNSLVGQKEVAPGVRSVFVQPVFVQSFRPIHFVQSYQVRLGLDENWLNQNELDEKQVYQLRGRRSKKSWEIEEKEAKRELRCQEFLFGCQEFLRCQQLPQIHLGQRCQMRGTGGNMDGGVGFHSTGRAEGARDQLYPLQKDERSWKRVVVQDLGWFASSGVICEEAV